ncbi:uncharacterized protein LOC144106695 isoform X2 [Amblyomma americanum]
MADYETSTYDSTIEGTSTYTSEGYVEPAPEEQASSKNNMLLKAGVVLIGVVLVVAIVLAISGSSSSSQKAEAAQGGSGEGDDKDEAHYSYIAQKKTSTQSTRTSASTTAKKSRRTTLSSSKKTTMNTTLTTTGKTTSGTQGQATQKTNLRTAATTTTQRPIPHKTLVCTFGPQIKASSPFPEDGLCDYIILEDMPSGRAQDFAEPFKAPVKHFIDIAAKHRKTEYGVGFDGLSSNKTKEVVKDPSVKKHLHGLFAKRIFHFGYINTPTYQFNKHIMEELLHILKVITSYLEDKKTPQRPIYTFMASTWSPDFDEVSALDASELFRTVLMPDLFISRAHLYDQDSAFEYCKIMPANFLKPPPQPPDTTVYFFSMTSAIQHIADLDKLRGGGVQTASLSLSVGLYGRWYIVQTDGYERITQYHVGDVCFQAEIPHQRASITEVCRNKKYKVMDSKFMDCRYIADQKTKKTFAYDTVETLRYKLCASKQNATKLKYGLTAVGLEFVDATNYCGDGKFGLLSTVKKILKFYAEEYTSPAAYKKCLG